jgi:hypothetical protein
MSAHEQTSKGARGLESFATVEKNIEGLTLVSQQMVFLPALLVM